MEVESRTLYGSPERVAGVQLRPGVVVCNKPVCNKGLRFRVFGG